MTDLLQHDWPRNFDEEYLLNNTVSRFGDLTPKAQWLLDEVPSDLHRL